MLFLQQGAVLFFEISVLAEEGELFGIGARLDGHAVAETLRFGSQLDFLAAQIGDADFGSAEVSLIHGSFTHDRDLALVPFLGDFSFRRMVILLLRLH